MKKRDNLPLNYKERLNSRTSFLVSIAVLVVLCLVFNQMDYTMIRQPAAQAKKAADLQKQKEEEAAATTQEVTTATVLAVGDNLVQPSLLASGQSETGAWNYDSVYANLKSDIQAADIAMVNQETPFTTDHSAVSGTAPYATPTEVGDALVNAGFNVVTSATALIDDNGSSMINETLNYWETSHPDVTLVGIHKNQSGIDAPKIVEINGIKIAFLNYTFPSYGSQTVSSGDSTDNSDGSANDSASSDTSDSSTGDADVFSHLRRWNIHKKNAIVIQNKRFIELTHQFFGTLSLHSNDYTIRTHKIFQSGTFFKKLRIRSNIKLYIRISLFQFLPNNY